MTRTRGLGLALALVVLASFSVGLSWSVAAPRDKITGADKSFSVTAVSKAVVASTLQWLQVQVITTEPTEVTFDVVVRSGDPTPVFSHVEAVADTYLFEWRGRLADGTPVANGNYDLNVTKTGSTSPDYIVKFSVNNDPPLDTEAPAAPTGLSVVPGLNNLLTWDASTEADLASYNVYSSTDKDTWKLEGGTLEPRFTDVQTREGLIWYRVTAVDIADNESEPSVAASNGWEPPPPPPEPPVDITATIGPEGGVIEANRVSLAIPAGALATPTDIRVKQWDTPPAPSGLNKVFMGPGFSITPHGLQFAVAAQLTIQMRNREDAPLPSGFPEDVSFMGVLNPTTNTFVKVPGYSVDEATRTVTAPLAHLSDYGPMGFQTPHGIYNSETTWCGVCHTAHAAPGPNLNSKPTQLETCLQCHGGPDGLPGAGSRYNIQEDFGLDKVSDLVWTADKTSYHPLQYTPDGATSPIKIVCGDCHSAHKDATAYQTLLRIWSYGATTTKTYTYSMVGGPDIGNAMCYNCHGTTNPRLTTGDPLQGPLPAPYGDHTAFETSIHATAAGGSTDEVQNVNISGVTSGTAAINEVKSVDISGLANGAPGTNEVQEYGVGKVQGTNGADTYTLTYSGCTTATIRRDATDAQIETALYGCPALNGNVSVTSSGGNTRTVVITFINGLAATNVSQITHTNVSGTPVTVAPSTTTQGVAVTPGEAFTLTFNGQTTTATLRKGTVTAGNVQSALEALPSIGVGNVSVAGTTGTGPFTVTFVGALGGTNVNQMTGTGLSGGTVSVTTTTDGVTGVPGEHFTLTFDGQTTSDATNPLIKSVVTAAQVRAALEALSNVGVGDVSVAGTTGTGPFTVTFVGALGGQDVPQMTGTGLGGGSVVVTTITQGVSASLTGNIACIGCHSPHASDDNNLTKGSQEAICYNCHTAATPNTIGGPNPPWTGGPFAGSNVFNAFNAKVNDTTTADGNGIRIYHHPIATGEQAGGSRQVECSSCHNAHVADRTKKAMDPAKATSTLPADKWDFGWDYTSGYMSRGTNVNQFCYKCHVSPTTTAPLNASANVPYDVRMVNDTANDADGNTHDKFASTQWLTSRHGDPTLDPTRLNYPGCASRGLTGEQCVVTCTNCHDPHGSTNANVLRTNVVSPDIRLSYPITNAVWASGQITLTIGANTIGSSYQVVVTGVTPAGYNGVYDVKTTGSPTIVLECTSATTPLCSLGSNPGAFVSGGTAKVGTYTLTNYEALNDAMGQYQIQAFCRTCHVERGTHNGGKLCTQCHFHGSNKL